MVPVAPLPVLTQQVSVLIGGLPAAATYAGPAPGMVNGVIQMNVRIPDLVASSPVTPLLVRVGSSESQPGVLLATGSVAQYSATVGTFSAAARWARPVSTPITTRARASSAAASFRLRRGATMLCAIRSASRKLRACSSSLPHGSTQRTP